MVLYDARRNACLGRVKPDRGIPLIGSYLFGRNGLLAGLAKLLDRLLIVSEILLATDEDDGETLAEVQNLGDPLLKSTCQQGCADRAGYQLGRG